MNSVQYTAATFGNKPDGSTTCGDGVTLNQTFYLVPNPSFGQLQVTNALNGPRVMQFALKWTFLELLADFQAEWRECAAGSRAS